VLCCVIDLLILTKRMRAFNDFIRFISKMLLRIERALNTLVSTASQTETGCIAAVAHSAYLRMLLATVSDISLLSAYQLKQANCWYVPS